MNTDYAWEHFNLRWFQIRQIQYGRQWNSVRAVIALVI
jgi:hypothetical protein